MNTFNPKDQFQTYHADSAAELGRQHDKPWLRISLSFALAQLASVGATDQELKGANRLIQYFINLSDKNIEMPSFPKRELTHLDNIEPNPKET